MFEDDEEPSFFQRYRILFAIGGLLLLGAAAFAFKGLMNKGSSSRQEPMTMIVLPPPPPPPPPKPTPTPPPPDQPPPENTHQDEKLVEEKIDVKPPPVAKPPDAPAPLGTSITGPGGADMGLGSGIGGLGGNGTGGGIGGGSRFGYYYGQVQRSVTDALRANPNTRKATISGLVVRIWPDSTGRVTRVELSGGTGDSGVDNAIRTEVLNGLQLSEAPPKDMKLPIILRISERRPN